MQRRWWWYCSDWSCETFSFCLHWGLNWESSGCLILHSTAPALQLLVFTSDSFRYLTLVQRDWWWYWSDWTCDRFSFCLHWGLIWGSSGSLVLHSATVSWWLLLFTSDNFRYLTLVQGDWWWYCSYWTCETFSALHLWQFQVFNSGAEELVVVLIWLGLVTDFLFAALGFDLGISGSLVLQLYHCAMALLSGFHLWQF